MKKQNYFLLAAAFCGSALFGGSLQAQPLVYGLTSTNSLVRFSASAGPVVNGPVISGIGAGETVVGIDFRPFTGDLYAVTRDGGNVGRLYTVNVNSGSATAVPLAGPTLAISGSVGVDFNPAAAAGVNALRIVSGDEHNYRLTFSSSIATVNVDGAINETNGAIATNVIATAYSNNRSGLPGGGGIGGTTQYAIDSALDRLYRVNPPNNGTLQLVGPLGIDVGSEGGLDIATSNDRALGLFTVGGANGLYEVTLTNGATSLLRSVPANVVDLAVALPVVFPPTAFYALSQTNSIVGLTTDGSASGTRLALTGLGSGETAVGIDFRPLDGLLYVVTRDGANVGHLYTADLNTGAATPVTLAGPAMTITGSVGIDFNPAAANGINALRVVTSDEHNYRLTFAGATATVNVDGAINVNGASATNLVATAYLNNRGGLPRGGGIGGTVQYALDSEADTLYRVNPPNNGTLTEAKPLGIDIGANSGLDITTDGDRALALLDIAGDKGIYEISLVNGTVGFVRDLPDDLVDLAVPVSSTLTGIARSVGGVTLNFSGGVGPYAVQRANVVTDPFCSIAAIAGKTFTLSNDGPTAFFRVRDLVDAAATRFTVSLSGAAERPTPASTTGTGFGTLELNGDTLTFDLAYSGLSSAAVAAHFHGPTNSSGATGVLIDLASYNGGAFGTKGRLFGSVGLTPALKAAFLSGLIYANVHSGTFSGGEVRGQVTPATFKTILRGASERTVANNSPGFGFGSFGVVGNELIFRIVYHGLTSAAIAAHIHGPGGSAEAVGVLIDLAPFHVGAFGRSGSFVGKVTLTPAQLAAVVDSGTYVNIHTDPFSGGEIRGQIQSMIGETPFTTELTGAAERPTPVTTAGSGFANLSLIGDSLSFQISYQGLSSSAVAAHIHGPSSATNTAAVLIDLAPFHRGAFSTQGVFVGTVTLAPQMKAALLGGDLYLNVHTSVNPNGEIRGQVTPSVLQVSLNGASERPTPVVTSATGYGYMSVIGKQIALGVLYRGLSGTAQAAHIHGPADVNTANGVLINLGSFAAGGFGADGLLLGSATLSDYDITAVSDYQTYVNIHTVANDGGEIRGQVVP